MLKGWMRRESQGGLGSRSQGRLCIQERVQQQCNCCCEVMGTEDWPEQGVLQLGGLWRISQPFPRVEHLS